MGTRFDQFGIGINGVVRPCKHRATRKVRPSIDRL